MFVNRLVPLARALTVATLAVLTVVGFDGPAAGASRHTASEFVRPRGQLDFFEVYHVADDTLYRAAVSLDALTSPNFARDYARVKADNGFAVDSLYRAVEDTTVYMDAPCFNSSVDVRWAIVLNYSDGTRQKIGFNRGLACLQISSRVAPVTASDDIVKFVDRTFGFMR